MCQVMRANEEDTKVEMQDKRARRRKIKKKGERGEGDRKEESIFLGGKGSFL